MGLFIAVLIFTFLLKKTVEDAKTDRALAEKGIVSPRLQAKYGDQAGAKTARYGMVDYLRDAWSDNWSQRTELRRAAVKAAGDAQPAPGRSRVSWRGRLVAARRAVAAVAEKAAPLVRKLIDPVPPRRDTEPDTPAPASVADPGPLPAADGGPRCPDCGEALTDTGTGWDHPQGPRCPTTGRPYRPAANPIRQRHATTDPYPSGTFRGYTLADAEGVAPGVADRFAGRPTCGRCLLKTLADDGTCPLCDLPGNLKGDPEMSAPTGEAVNYETTVAELEAIEREQMNHVDQAAACLDAVVAAKAAIDGMQESYNTTAAAAKGVNEHLGALLPGDGETLAQVGTIGDAMPPNKVNDMFDHLELIEAEAEQQKQNAATALAATRAAIGRVQSEYGEEAAKVASNLGGDPTFLGSSGATAAPAAPVGAGV